LPEEENEEDVPEQGEVVQGALQLGRYKIFFYFESFVHESNLLSFLPPTCIAHPVAIPLHDYRAVYDPPLDPPSICHAPYKIGNYNVV